MEVMQLSYEGKFNKTKLGVEADAYTAIATIDKLSEYLIKDILVRQIIEDN